MKIKSYNNAVLKQKYTSIINYNDYLYHNFFIITFFLWFLGHYFKTLLINDYKNVMYLWKVPHQLEYYEQIYWYLKMFTIIIHIGISISQYHFLHIWNIYIFIHRLVLLENNLQQICTYTVPLNKYFSEPADNRNFLSSQILYSCFCICFIMLFLFVYFFSGDIFWLKQWIVICSFICLYIIHCYYDSF